MMIKTIIADTPAQLDQAVNGYNFEYHVKATQTHVTWKGDRMQYTAVLYYELRTK